MTNGSSKVQLKSSKLGDLNIAPSAPGAASWDLSYWIIRYVITSC